MTYEDSDDRKKRYHKSMLKAHVNAYIQRALTAGIPKRYLRIGPDKFKLFLSTEYHGKEGVEAITNFIYKKPFDLMKIPFIAIDGGKIVDRKKAAFAIMFRMITCDNYGKFYNCSSLVHKLNTFDAKGVTHGDRRVDFADSLKAYNVLCISEFRRELFNEHCEGGTFFDEIIDQRVNDLSPTIVTFQAPINANNALTNLTCGQYLNELSHKEKLTNNPSEDVLRIRVRSSDNGNG